MSRIFSNNPFSKASDARDFQGFKNNVFDDSPATMQRKIDAPFDKPVKIGISSTDEPVVQGRPEDHFPPEMIELFDKAKAKAVEILADARNKADELTRDSIVRSDQIRASGKIDAEKMIDNARHRIEEVEAEAYQAGFEQGEKAGHQLGEQKIEPVMRSIKALLENIASAQENLFELNEEELVKAAFLIALHLIQREIRMDPSVITDVVHNAIGRVETAASITIFLSPHDLKFLDSYREEIQSAVSPNSEVKLEVDATISRGGCKIVSNTGEVDATIESMIEAVHKRIWDVD